MEDAEQDVADVADVEGLVAVEALEALEAMDAVGCGHQLVGINLLERSGRPQEVRLPL